MAHPQAETLDVCCLLYVEGMMTGKQQLQELVMYLDSAYQKHYQQQVMQGMGSCGGRGSEGPLKMHLGVGRVFEARSCI